MSTQLDTVNNSILASTNDMYVICPSGTFASNIFNSNVLNLITTNSISFGASTGTYIYNDNSTINNYITTGGTGGGGFQGAQGPIGLEGAQGPQGLEGSIGLQGLIGATGSVGPQGLEGDTGSVGPQGLEGAIGPQGLIGATGSVGPQGLEGSVGPQGLIGATGSVGPQGLEGSVGLQGLIGATGSVGPQGLIGATGSVGPQGPAGGGGNITNPLNNALVSSDGTSSGLVAKSGLIYDNTQLSVSGNITSGNIAATGLYIQSITGLLNQYIDTTKSINIINLTGAYGSWATRISGISVDQGYGIAADTLGNSYVTGLYNSPATVYNSDGTAFRTLAGSGSNEAFVVKYETTGMGSWVTRISGTSTDGGYGIAVDTVGNSYVTGQYISPATVYNSDGTAFRTLAGSGTSEAFVVRYETTGMGSWATRISGTSDDVGISITVDTVGNSYVTGYYTSPATVYNSDGTAFRTLAGSGSNDAFVVKYGTTGMASWISRVSGTSNDAGTSITVDTVGNSYVTGYYTSPATVYNSDGTAFATLVGVGSQEAFVIKYGTTGMGSWVTKITGISNDSGQGIAVDTSGNSYVTGQYVSPATVYNSDGTAFATLIGAGSSEAFVIKYGPTGMGSWVTKITGISSDTGQGIAVDTVGNSYVTGLYTQPATVYNSDETAFATLIGNGANEAFLIKYGPTGMGSWLTKISGTSNDLGYGIAVDTSGNSYVSGRYVSSATFYNADGTAFTTLSGSGSFDAYIVKYNDGPNGVYTFNLLDLDNIPSNNGKTLYIANNVYGAGFVLNIQTQSGVTYLSFNITSSISLTFFNGKWIPLSRI